MKTRGVLERHIKNISSMCKLTTWATFSIPGMVLMYPGSHLRLVWTCVSVTVVEVVVVAIAGSAG